MSSTTYDRQWPKPAIFANEFNFSGLKSQTHRHFGNVNKMVHHLGVVTAMVRNAGQLPQPFWLGAACGGGSCSAALCTVRNELEEKKDPGSQTAAIPEPRLASYSTAGPLQSEFVEAASAVPFDALMDILDEHMKGIRLVYPKEYELVIKRLRLLD